MIDIKEPQPNDPKIQSKEKTNDFDINQSLENILKDIKELVNENETNPLNTELEEGLRNYFKGNKAKINLLINYINSIDKSNITAEESISLEKLTNLLNNIKNEEGHKENFEEKENIKREITLDDIFKIDEENNKSSIGEILIELAKNELGLSSWNGEEITEINQGEILINGTKFNSTEFINKFNQLNRKRIENNNKIIKNINIYIPRIELVKFKFEGGKLLYEGKNFNKETIGNKYFGNVINSWISTGDYINDNEKIDIQEKIFNKLTNQIKINIEERADEINPKNTIIDNDQRTMSEKNYETIKKALGDEIFIEKSLDGEIISYNRNKTVNFLEGIKKLSNEDRKNLKKNTGKRLAYITAIQILLNEEYENQSIKIDGILKKGGETEKLIKQYQKKYNNEKSEGALKLKEDGIPGKNTLTVLLEGEINNTAIGGIGEIKKDGNMIFKNGGTITLKGKEYKIINKGKECIRINGKNYHKQPNNGLGYESGINDDGGGYLYIGEYKNSNWHGNGNILRDDGDRYEGNRNNGRRSGKGSYYSNYGSVYEGYWKDGNIYKGTLKYTNGEKYIGQFNKDRNFEGQGKFMYNNGKIYEGGWKNGERNGKGTMTYQNGNKNILVSEKGIIKKLSIINSEGKEEGPYDVIKDEKGIKITSQGEKNGKYISEATGKINDWNINEINPKNIEDILGRKIEEGDEKKLRNLLEKGVNINMGNIENILEFDERELTIFDTNNEIYYDGYDYKPEELETHYHYKRGRIIENIEKYIQNFIDNNEKRNLGRIEIIEQVRSDLVTLPKNDRTNIIIGINKVVEKFNTVHKYLDFENGPYKTPKELLCAIRGIEHLSSNITEDITVRQYGVGLTFYVGEKKSLQILYDEGLTDSGNSSFLAGFNCSDSNIKELEGTLSVVNSKDPGNDTESFDYSTMMHEGQHNRNSYFMPDNDYKALSRAKDEITAYLREGYGIFKEDKWHDTIELYLTQTENEGGIYQYVDGKDWELHKEKVWELLTYANNLIKLTKYSGTGITRENIISMLCDTPAEERCKLHSTIMKSSIITEDNGLDQNNILNIKEFWRAGTAEKQTTINEILVANTIEEVKYILCDPKYSHISRQPNNKGGIEISAIIDEVISGNLETTYIPSEIRPKIEQLIIK